MARPRNGVDRSRKNWAQEACLVRETLGGVPFSNDPYSSGGRSERLGYRCEYATVHEAHWLHMVLLDDDSGAGDVDRQLQYLEAV